MEKLKAIGVRTAVATLEEVCLTESFIVSVLLQFNTSLMPAASGMQDRRQKSKEALTQLDDKQQQLER